MAHHHKIYNALGNFEYIVTDTALCLGMLYIDKPHANTKLQSIDPFVWDNIRWQYKGLLDQIGTMYDGMLFFKERENFLHQMEGRMHTADQSALIEKELKELLTSRGIQFTIANDFETCKKHFMEKYCLVELSD